MSTSVTSTQPRPTAGTYTIDPGASSLSLHTKHMFGLGKVSGTFAIASGEITVTSPIEGSFVVVSIDAASFDTKKLQRDKAVRDKFLDASASPTISFRSTELVDNGANWSMSGQLTVRENAAPVTVVVTELTTDGASFVVTGTCRVDRYALGVTAMKAMAARFLDVAVRVRMPASVPTDSMGG